MSTRAALITALIVDRPLCVDCLVMKSGLPAAELDATMAAVATALALHRTMDRCRACGVVTTVLSFERPAV